MFLRTGAFFSSILSEFLKNLVALHIHWEDTVHPIGDLEPEYRAMLEKLLEQARALGRAPLRSEVEEALRKKLIARCGSWRNTLYQIGLEPVAHITPFSGTVLSNTNKGTKRHRTVLHECYYKVLNLDERAKRELEEVRRLAEKLGRPPKRKEAPEALRKDLQKWCGSWSNTLFQLGLQPEKKKTFQGTKEPRE